MGTLMGVGVLLSLLLLLPVTVASAQAPPQQDAVPPGSGSVDPSLSPALVDDWTFLERDLRDATVYAQPDLDSDAGARLIRAIEVASTEVPARFGLESLGPIDYYLLASSDDFRRALEELGGLPGSQIGLSEAGHSLASGRHPGIYVDATSQEEDGRAVWLVAHELTHQAEARLANRGLIPQWFNEGVAEYVGAAVAARLAPDYAQRRDFLSRARLASSADTGTLPSLIPLRRQMDWVQATATGSTTYYAASALVVGQVVDANGWDAVPLILSAIGYGVPFDESFQQITGQSVAEVDGALSSYVDGTLVPQFPTGLSADRSSLPGSQRIQLAFVGLQPSEVATWSFVGPGTCRGQGSITATREGFSSYSFGLRPESQTRCAGPWVVTVTGDRGSTGRYDFTFLPTP